MALQFFPVTIGRYDNWTTLAVEPESRTVEELLADFGGEPVRWNAPDARDANLVESRLREWAEDCDPGNTFLYWLGHGWSDGANAALAHTKSPQELDTGGIAPEAFYGYLRRRTAAAGDTWAIVVFDTCGSKRFVERLSSTIYSDEHGPRRFMLVGSADGGAVNLGRFGRVLRFVLTKTFGGVQEVELGLLGHELRRVLGDESIVVSEVPARAALQRSVPPVAGTQVDQADELRAVLATLSKDEQRHFIPKAQGAELGEFSWFFEGREAERKKVATWLRRSTGGMLVITGVPGAGKSAFLGDLVVQSRPELRRVLLRREFIALVRAENRPPDGAFDAVIHLTGSTPTQLLHRIAQAVKLSPPPRDRNLGAQTAWLISKLGKRPFTLMVDALDEAQQPLTIAESVLKPLSAAPNVRVLVGTRVSTSEGPDRSAADHDILEALGVSAQLPIRLRRDPAAISRYVFRRLVKSLGHDEGLEEFSTEIGRRDKEFLFARLAVRELIEEPRLLVDQAAVDELLSCSHGELFTRAVARLTAADPVFGFLLTALALAQGRGLPIVHGIWAALAQSLSDNLEVTDDHIDRLIELAAPYLILDVENDETVYRLAHRTFAESLTGTPGDLDRHFRITRAMVEMTRGCKSADEWFPYVSHHLYNHAAAGGAQAWLEVDRLNPRQVALSALRHHFGQLRPEVAGIIGAQHLLLRLPPDQRVGTRQLAMTRYGRVIRPSGQREVQPGSWGIRWARMRQHPIHLVLAGHSAAVVSVVAFPGIDGGTLLASGSQDRTIRIWDPARGTQQGQLSAGHKVNAITYFPGGEGGSLLASAGEDGNIRLWDPITQTQIGRPLKGHNGPINVIISVADHDGRPLLVSGGSDRTVRLWDPSSRRSVGQVPQSISYHADRISCLGAFTGPRGRVRLVGGTDDGAVVIWDLATGAVLDTLTGHSGRVAAISVFRDVDENPILCVSSEEATVLWNAADGSTAGFLMDRPGGTILGSVTFTDAAGSAFLATCAVDGTARMWDLSSRRPVGNVLSGHLDEARSIAVFEQRAGQKIIVTGGEDCTVRVWEPSATDAGGFEPDISGPVTTVRRLGRLRYVSAVDAGRDEIAVWSRLTGELRSKSRLHAHFPNSRSHIFPTPDGGSLAIVGGKRETEIHLTKITDHEELINSTTTTKWSAVVPITTPRGKTLMAVISQFGDTIQLVDPEARRYLDFSLRLNGEEWTKAATTFKARDGSTMLAIGIRAYEDYKIAYSSLTKKVPSMRFRTNHTEPIAALTSIGHLLVGGGQDGTLRAWDPVTAREMWILQLGVGIRALEAVGQDICVGTDDGIVVIALSDRLVPGSQKAGRVQVMEGKG